MALTTDHITQEYLESLVVKEQYHTYEGTTFTTCLLHLENGFKLHGEADVGIITKPADEELGRQFARSNAITKLWALEGYLLRQKLHDAAQHEAELADARSNYTITRNGAR